MSRKKLIILAAGLLIAGLVVYWFFIRDNSGILNSSGDDFSKNVTPERAEKIEQRAKDDSTIRLIATGDTIGHDSINAAAKQPNGSFDYYPMMDKMQPFFDGADVRFCNQATPAGGEQFGISGYPVFNAPLEFTRDMVRLGCNLVNTGTNHTYDKGQPLIDNMVAEWNKQDILAHAGANASENDKNTVKYFEVKGVKFAFLSYSTYSNSPISNGYGVTMYNRSLAESQLKEASEKADINVVSMRWGTEYSPDINSLQDRVSQELANMGADIIFGHGPHVLEPVKNIKGAGGSETLVWYSLGNFLNTQLDIESLTGVIAVMDIDTSSKKIKKIQALPIYNHYEWTARQKARQDLLARRNIEMYPLDKAAAALKRSQNNTTVSTQTARIKEVLNRYLDLPIIKSGEY